MSTGNDVAKANTMGSIYPDSADNGMSKPKQNNPLVGQNDNANKMPSNSAPQQPLNFSEPALPEKPNLGRLSLCPISIKMPIISSAGPIINSPV